MEVPATSAGKIRDVKVRVAQSLARRLLAIVETPPLQAAPPAPAPAAAPAASPAPVAAPPAPAPVAATNACRGNGFVVHASPASGGSRANSRYARRGARQRPNGASRATTCKASSRRRSLRRSRGQRTARPAAAVAAAAVAKVDFEKFGPIERSAHAHPEALGANLARNWVMIPHVTQCEDAT